MEREQISVVTREMITQALNCAKATLGAYLCLAARPDEFVPIRWQAKRGAPVQVVYKLSDVHSFLSRMCPVRYSPAATADLVSKSFTIAGR